MDWTPAEACREGAKLCDDHDPCAAFVILLDKGKDGKEFNTAFRNAGLSTSEAVSLLAVVQSDLIKIMRGEE